MALILITGCGSGFGSSLAVRLAKEGHEVIATVRSLKQKKFISDNSELITTASNIQYIQMDVTIKEEVTFVFEQLALNKKVPDAVILNAASYAFGTVETAQYDNVKQSFEVNYWGAVNVIRACIPFMRQKNSGKIIGIGSISSKVGLPCDGYYSATKAALSSMLESLKYEVAAFGIHVSMLSPGSFGSNLFNSLPENACKKDPYSPLLNHWLKQIQEKDNKQAIAIKDVEDVILKIISTKEPEFDYPVGKMAEQVIGKLKKMSATERSEAILNWSKARWWSDKNKE